jgi:uncharacterized membrane protein YphA (DoxX/SURF4 family)
MPTSYTLRWIVTLAVAITFAGAGAAKLANDPVFAALFQEWGFPLWLMYAIGVFEIVCAILLCLPRSAPYAAVGLLAVAVGAFTVQAFHGHMLGASLPAFLAAGAGILVWGSPHRAPRLRRGTKELLPDDTILPARAVTVDLSN